MARSDLHTALGGTQLGMSLPLAGLSGMLAVLGGPSVGLDRSPSDIPLAALALLSATLLATAGSLLLWGEWVDAPMRTVARPRTQLRARRSEALSTRAVTRPLALQRAAGQQRAATPQRGAKQQRTAARPAKPAVVLHLPPRALARSPRLHARAH